VDALPAPTTKGNVRCSGLFVVPRGLFDECVMNGKPVEFHRCEIKLTAAGQKKSGCGEPDFPF
jgi:hypothetical protein